MFNFLRRLFSNKSDEISDKSNYLPPPPPKPKSEVEEINTVIAQYATIMNGQLRGTINKVASDQNMETLTWGLSTMFQLGYNYGKEQGNPAIIEEFTRNR